MEKDSALYQLMDTRMNGVMNGIVSSDGEYQAILRKSDIYSDELERMERHHRPLSSSFFPQFCILFHYKLYRIMGFPIKRHCTKLPFIAPNDYNVLPAYSAISP